MTRPLCRSVPHAIRVARLCPLVLLILITSIGLAGATVTLGISSDRHVRIENSDIQEFADFLQNHLGEEVKIRSFEKEQTLSAWMITFQQVDLALVSGELYHQTAPGKLYYLADCRNSSNAALLYFVARQGLSLQGLNRLHKAVDAMQSDPEFHDILQKAGGLKISVRNTRQSAFGPSDSARPEDLPRFTPDRQPVSAEAPAKRAVPQATETKPKQSVSPIKKQTLPETSSAKAVQFYQVEQLRENIYAALVSKSNTETTNAFFFVGPTYVVAAGAHMTAALAEDLLRAVRSATDKPVRYLVLTHHHPDAETQDLDLPKGIEVILSWQSWQELNEVRHTLPYPALFFSHGMTLRLGDRTLVLTNLEKGHCPGNSILFIPEEKILFTSDLAYFNHAGIMKDGEMREWVKALNFMTKLGAESIVPGRGLVGTAQDLKDFHSYFTTFQAEILRFLDHEASLQEVLETYSLPEFSSYPGYQQHLKDNLTRSYIDLKSMMEN